MIKQCFHSKSKTFKTGKLKNALSEVNRFYQYWISIGSTARQIEQTGFLLEQSNSYDQRVQKRVVTGNSGKIQHPEASITGTQNLFLAAMTSISALEDMTNHFVSEVKMSWLKFFPDSQFVVLGCSAMPIIFEQTDVPEVSKALQKPQN